LIIEGHEEAPTTSSDISGYETDQRDKSELPATTGSGGAVLPMEMMGHETMVTVCHLCVSNLCICKQLPKQTHK
jgi:hypothetical protein